LQESRFESERQRVVHAKHEVKNLRIDGKLEPTRGLGDFVYKPTHSSDPRSVFFAVSPIPEVSILHRRLDATDMVVIGCDGVWKQPDGKKGEGLNNEQACGILAKNMREGKNSVSSACNALLEEVVVRRPVGDNVSAIVISISPATCVRADSRVDQLLFLPDSANNNVRTPTSAGSGSLMMSKTQELMSKTLELPTDEFADLPFVDWSDYGPKFVTEMPAAQIDSKLGADTVKTKTLGLHYPYAVKLACGLITVAFVGLAFSAANAGLQSLGTDLGVTTSLCILLSGMVVLY
jgi:hypothetical protein